VHRQSLPQLHEGPQKWQSVASSGDADLSSSGWGSNTDAAADNVDDAFVVDAVVVVAVVVGPVFV
jgi:hypothetical protein